MRDSLDSFAVMISGRFAIGNRFRPSRTLPYIPQQGSIGRSTIMSTLTLRKVRERAPL